MDAVAARVRRRADWRFGRGNASCYAPASAALAVVAMVPALRRAVSIAWRRWA